METDVSYQRCARILDELIEHPPSAHGSVFTELEIVRKVLPKDWDPETEPNLLKQAHRQANMVCGSYYRDRKLSRFGPVELSNGSKDYARIAAKIAYAPAEGGPEVWETPNGVFPKLMLEDDDITQQGRRYSANRNDLEPWDEQDFGVAVIHPATAATAHTNGNGKASRKTQARRLRELEAMMKSHDKRLKELEQQEKKRAKLYARPA